MVKNILKYTLFGLAASFAFAYFTIDMIEPREKLISELPQYWQVIWLVLLNAVGMAACFIARLITPVLIKTQKKHEKFIAVILSVFVVFLLIMMGGKRSRGGGGLLMYMHKSLAIEALAAVDVLTFFCLMLFAYFILYVLFEYRYKTKK